MLMHLYIPMMHFYKENTRQQDLLFQFTGPQKGFRYTHADPDTCHFNAYEFWSIPNHLDSFNGLASLLESHKPNYLRYIFCYFINNLKLHIYLSHFGLNSCIYCIKACMSNCCVIIAISIYFVRLVIGEF